MFQERGTFGLDVGDPGADRIDALEDSMRRIEAAYGPRWDATNHFGLEQVTLRDHRGEFSELTVSRWVRLDLGDDAVPEELGGRFRGLDVYGHLLRAGFRRDQPAALLWGFYQAQAALFVFLAGSPLQQRRIAEALRFHRPVGTAFHRFDEASESDDEFTARRLGDAIEVGGRRTHIPGGQHLHHLLAVAATGDLDEPYTMLLLDLGALTAECMTPVDLRDRSGLRSVPIQGLELTRLIVPAESIVGCWGRGLDAGWRGLIPAQVLLPLMLLGAMDTAIGAVVQHQRDNGGFAPRAEPVRPPLAGAFADTLVADSLAIVAARSVHLIPERSHVLSAASRHFVPIALRESLMSLTPYFGAAFVSSRSYGAVVEKLVRDLDAIAFAAPGQSNALSVIAANLIPDEVPDGDPWAPPGSLFDPAVDLPPLDGERLAAGGGHDGLFVAVDRDRQRIELELGLHPDGADVSALVDDLCDEYRKLRSRCTGLGEDAPSVETIALANRTSILLAGAAAILLWSHSGESRRELGGGVDWLHIGLQRLLHRLGVQRDRAPAEVYLRVVAEAERREADGISIGLLGLRYGASQ